MDILGYIPLLVVFATVFYSVFKGKSLKHYEEMAKTTLPGRESEEIISLPEMLTDPSGLEAKTPEKKVASPVRKIMVPLEGEEVVENFSFGEEEEFRKGILYSEILNRGKEDRFF